MAEFFTFALLSFEKGRGWVANEGSVTKKKKKTFVPILSGTYMDQYIRPLLYGPFESLFYKKKNLCIIQRPPVSEVHYFLSPIGVLYLGIFTVFADIIMGLIPGWECCATTYV